MIKIFTCPLISKYSSYCSNPLVTVPSTLITIGINVTFIFHSFFSSQARSRYLFLLSLSFTFTLWPFGTIMSINAYVYIYIYIYINVCVWVCVCLWMGGRRRDLFFSIFTGVRVSRWTPLSILVRRPHQVLRPRKPVRREEERGSVRSETPKSKVRHSELRMWGQKILAQDAGLDGRL